MNLKYIVTPFLLAIAFLLSSCNMAPPSTKVSTKPPIEEKPAITPEAKCIAGGGEWKRITRGGSLTCNQKFSDAGKACNDGAVCESNTCIAPRREDTQGTAQCAATTSAIVHAGCRGGKMVKGKIVPLGCP